MTVTLFRPCSCDTEWASAHYGSCRPRVVSEPLKHASLNCGVLERNTRQIEGQRR